MKFFHVLLFFFSSVCVVHIHNILLAHEFMMMLDSQSVACVLVLFFYFKKAELSYKHFTNDIRIYVLNNSMDIYGLIFVCVFVFECCFPSSTNIEIPKKKKKQNEDDMKRANEGKKCFLSSPAFFIKFILFQNHSHFTLSNLEM